MEQCDMDVRGKPLLQCITFQSNMGLSITTFKNSNKFDVVVCNILIGWISVRMVIVYTGLPALSSHFCTDIKR
jgi:hypothetical protein